MTNPFASLPSVDRAMDILTADPDLTAAPRDLLKELVNRFLDLCRDEIRQGDSDSDPDKLMVRMSAFVREGVRPKFRRVINATGVVVHTNMGRSLLAESAVRAVSEACSRYSNLEFDLETGARGSRYSHVEEMLCQVTGAESALVVNNNAAAVLIVLETMAAGREVIVSRGQLVEIGGSFRIPDVMTKSGARLREVGATNRTHVFDYEQAIGEETAALMRVHTSNYRVVGFTKEVSLSELRDLGEKHSIPVIEDLGSGNLYDFKGVMQSEPTVDDVVRDGADVVTFSGDKILGGPQAGIIVGRREYIERIKRNPMNRAMRIDKMTLAALEATLRLYLDPASVRQEVPTLEMITRSEATLKSQAGRLARLLRSELGGVAEIETRKGASRVGGGANPEGDLPTYLVRIIPEIRTVENVRQALLRTDPPMAVRVENDALCLDPRTIFSDEYRLVARVLKQTLV